MEEVKTQSSRAGWLLGALLGGVFMAPLIAISFVGEQWQNLPFIPFDFFDWLARVLPGDVIRFGINRIIDFIQAFNLGETSSTAKILEQVQGVVFVVGIGILAGALVFVALRRIPAEHAGILGGAAGAVLGLFFALINASLRSESAFVEQADGFVSAVFIIALFIAWGLALGWVYAQYSGETEPQATQINRRQFLVQMSGAAATITVMGVGAGTLLSLNRRDNVLTTTPPETVEIPDNLPNMSASLQPASGTRPEYTPIDDHYRIDISARPPTINGETYRLNVRGMVSQPLEISLNDLMENYEPVDQFVTLSCISNRIAGDLISTTRWTGIPFHRLLEDWGVDENASYLRIISADGFDEWVSLDVIRNDTRVMLCYAWDGQPLKQKHGFPLRIFIPDLYGMKQPKWITDIEVTDSWGEGYWVVRRWDAAARVQPVSVIDTVAVNDAYEQDGAFYIPVGGIAYSGAKEISRVEISVDDGDWQIAELREPLSDTTWVLWRFDWPFEPGQHRFAVRCHVGNGTLQPVQTAGTFPSGATGIHNVSTRLPSELEIS